jgi:hypothetical protein
MMQQRNDHGLNGTQPEGAMADRDGAVIRCRLLPATSCLALSTLRTKSIALLNPRTLLLAQIEISQPQIDVVVELDQVTALSIRMAELRDPPFPKTKQRMTIVNIQIKQAAILAIVP